MYGIPGFCRGCQSVLRPRSRTAGNPRKWCSDRCRVRFVRYGRPLSQIECRQCRSQFTQRRLDQVFCEARCSMRWHNARRPPSPERTIPCAECRAEFTTRQPRQLYCSTLCANRALNRRLWASGSRRKFPHVTTRQRRLVADRDHWRCGICHAVIDPELRWPHPGSLSLDHIDPFGRHEPANWQAAHLRCNIQAGDKRAVA